MKDIDSLTDKQRIFCQEYIYDWNATRAYKVAYPNIKADNIAQSASSRLLLNVIIQDYIKLIRSDIEKLAKTSVQRVLEEHFKIAYSSIAHLHNTWIERKEFEALTDDEKASIQEISTKVVKMDQGGEPVYIEYVKVKLYDKQRSLEAIAKILGYNAPEKIEGNANIVIKGITFDE